MFEFVDYNFRISFIVFTAERKNDVGKQSKTGAITAQLTSTLSFNCELITVCVYLTFYSP